MGVLEKIRDIEAGTFIALLRSDGGVLKVVFRRLGVRKRGHREDISTVSAGLTVSRCERV
jgi:hypothetical protein